MSEAPSTNVLSLISYAEASQAIAAGMAYAETIGARLSLVVLDSAGHLVCAGRMDGAAFVTIEIARGKAFASVATGGQPGRALAQRYAENPMVWSVAASLGYGAPMLPATGSLPIWRDGVLVGAMGASGAPSDIDEAALAHAIAAIGAKTTD
jgi:uncharacterized protein GlcG (DUF336 family)